MPGPPVASVLFEVGGGGLEQLPRPAASSAHASRVSDRSIRVRTPSGVRSRIDPASSMARQ